MTANQNPATIGRIVHFASDLGDCVAAIVTETEGHRVQLTAFFPGVTPVPSPGWVNHDEDPRDSGTWHWPAGPLTGTTANQHGTAQITRPVRTPDTTIGGAP